ncbi:MAG: crossover junction endodeoxyribonuclease RuvC [Eubacteriales bacterium]
MLIIGIDPGFARMGFGIVQMTTKQLIPVEYGCIETDMKLSASLRLKQIYEDLQEILQVHRPSHFAIEKLFFNKNTRTALSVGEARGVALLAASVAGLCVFEYTPLQVKMSVAGYGKADKKQVCYMVKAILHLNAYPNLDDTTDALAVAICHAQSTISKELINI